MIDTESDVETDSDYDSDDESETATSLQERAQKARDGCLPVISCKRYKEQYATFLRWKKQNKFKTTTEDMLLVYFNEKLDKMKPSTLWSIWSMLRSMLALKEDIDIRKFTLLKSFVKTKNAGHKKKKAHVLTSEQIRSFLISAPDEQYLLTKVIFLLINFNF